jgi:DNA-binding NtrC family response regulator
MKTNDLSALKILHVEDSENDAQLIQYTLKGSGMEFDYHRVWSESTLVEALQQQPWDVILCDHNLPGFTSFRALELVREMEIDLPFIVVSGVLDLATVVEAMRMGAHDFINKSDLRRLVDAIKRALQPSGKHPLAQSIPALSAG